MKKILFLAAGLSICLGICFSNQSVKAAGDLFAYWKFDETSGTTAVDSSGTGNDGTLLGGVTPSTDVPAIACFIDPGSFQFDGNTGSYVNIPDASSMDPTSEISLSLWVKPTVIPAPGTFEHIVFKQQFPGLTSYGIWLSDSGTIYFESNNGAVQGLFGTTPLTLNSWHYIAATYDGTTQKIFVDGALDNSVARPGITLSYGGNPLKIGSGDFNSAFSGFIDEVRIYDRGLTDAEVTSIANGSCGPNVTAPVTTASTPPTTTADDMSAAASVAPVSAPNTGLAERGMAKPLIALAVGTLLALWALYRYRQKPALPAD